MEIGSIILYPSITVPTGFLVCDGSAVLRDLYSQLFDVIGTTYGPGDGVSTFNLPNLSGRVSVGKSSTYLLGSTGGEETHILDTTEIASHDHVIPSHTHEVSSTLTVPTLSHTVTQPQYSYVRLNGTTSRSGSAGYKSWRLYNTRYTSNMTRTTDLAVSNHPATACTVSGEISDCAAFDTESAGLGDGHNNMMPYLTLTYLIYAPETVYPPGMVYFNGAMVTGPSGCYFTGKG
jgi:microcystin-dependent protein